MLNLAFVVGAGLTALTFIPAVQTFFGTTMLSVGELFISIGCAFAIIPLVELQKFIEYLIKRNKQKKIQNFVIEEQNEVDSQN